MIGKIRINVFMKASILLSTLLLISCKTPYKDYNNGFLGGYIDREIGKNLFKVKYICNPSTTYQECDSLAQKRSLEFCSLQGNSPEIIERKNGLRVLLNRYKPCNDVGWSESIVVYKCK